MDKDAIKKRLTEERERLRQLRDGLAEETTQPGAGGEDVSELSSVDQHPADIGTEEFEREKDLSIIENLEGELASIETVFARVEDGTYGKCEVCGKDIGAERLEARPAATLCIDHQQEAERA